MNLQIQNNKIKKTSPTSKNVKGLSNLNAKLIKHKSQTKNTTTYSSPSIFQCVSTNKKLTISTKTVSQLRQNKQVKIYNPKTGTPISCPTHTCTYICNLQYQTGTKRANNVVKHVVSQPFQINFTKSQNVSITICLTSSSITVTCPNYTASNAATFLQAKVVAIVKTLNYIKTLNTSVNNILNNNFTLFLFGQAYPVVLATGSLNVQFKQNNVSITYNNNCNNFQIAHAIKMAYTKQFNKYAKAANMQINKNNKAAGFSIVVNNSGHKCFKKLSSKNSKTLCVSSLFAAYPMQFLNYHLYANIAKTCFPVILPASTQKALCKSALKAVPSYKSLVQNKQYKNSMQNLSGLYNL